MSSKLNHLSDKKTYPLIVSIVTWNSAGSIQQCINSLLQQTFTDFQIWVVDNNSFDGTISIIQQLTDPRIKLIPLKENTGFCGGHNYIINHTASEYILLVNPDALLEPDYIQKAINRIKEDQATGTVCGLLLQSLSDENAIIDSAGMDFCPDGRFLLRHHGKRLKDAMLKVTEVAGADGALPLYRRKMIDEIKVEGMFFDEMFFAHKEDWDVSWRSRRLGWKTVFDPDCRAVHPRSFRQGSLSLRKNMSETVKYHAVKNQLLLLIKNESQFFQKSFSIIPRQIATFLYLLLFERGSLKAYGFIIKKRKKILAVREEIQKKIAVKNHITVK